MSENLLNNSVLAGLVRQAGPSIVGAIKGASEQTGVKFAYLMEQAAAESSFNADAKANTSSATGLFQFIESTWLNMMKKHGSKYGLGELAKNINSDGKVSDGAIKDEILSMRYDPEIASLLAAELAAENKEFLEKHVGGEIGSTELYFAHFMGASGAAGFLNAMKSNPLTTAADLFPKAARANRNVFYESQTGEGRSLASVYDFFDRKFGANESVEEGGIKNSELPSKKPTYRRNSPQSISPSYGVFSASSVFELLSGRNQQTSENRNIPFISNRYMPSLLANPAELMMLSQLDLLNQDYKKSR